MIKLCMIVILCLRLKISKYLLFLYQFSYRSNLPFVVNKRTYNMTSKQSNVIEAKA